MHVVEIVSTGALTTLRPAWEDLWERCSEAGPFQHPDWLLPWWSHLGGGELWSVAVFDRDRLAAFAPCFIYLDPQDGTRQLTLLGNGISDRLDFLAAADAPAAADSLVTHMRSRRDHWDSCDFRDLPARSVVAEKMADAPAAVVSDEAPCPALDLKGANADLSGTAPTKLLANLRNRWRRAETHGDAEVQRADSDSLSTALDALFRLHAARWGALGQDGVLHQSALDAFHREVAMRFLRRDWLRLYLLRLDLSIVAANYGFHVRGRAYSYIGGLDPRLTKLAPGALVMRHAISEAVREGAVSFDFLRGAEDYKYAWGAKDQRQYRVQVATERPHAT